MRQENRYFEPRPTVTNVPRRGKASAMLHGKERHVGCSMTGTLALRNRCRLYKSPPSGLRRLDYGDNIVSLRPKEGIRALRASTAQSSALKAAVRPLVLWMQPTGSKGGGMMRVADNLRGAEALGRPGPGFETLDVRGDGLLPGTPLVFARQAVRLHTLLGRAAFGSCICSSVID